MTNTERNNLEEKAHEEALREEKMRDLIWKKAGGGDTGLAFIMESWRDFQIGKLATEDGKHYFLTTTDVHGDQTYKVNLTEKELREGDFTDEMRTANTDYQRRLYEAKREKASRRRTMKNKIKTIGKIFLTLGVIGTAGFGIYKYETTPEAIAERKERALLIERERELDKKAVFLSDKLKSNWTTWISFGESRAYQIEGVGEAVASVGRSKDLLGDDGEGTSRMRITLNNNTRFFSQWWISGASDDAKYLEHLQIREGDNWISVENISDERNDEWKNLIEKIYDIESGKR